MRRATITLPEDLEAAIDAYRAAQSASASLTAIVQAALRAYLSERGYLTEPRRLRITPAAQGSGQTHISIAHDREIADA